jgi:hypothetical protein
MTSSPAPHRPWRDAAPWLLALVGFFAVEVRLLSVGGGPVLWPFTDAFEYASMAHWMAQGEGAVLRIGPAFVPARVPPTFSVLLLPQAWLDGDPRRFWMTPFAIGVALVLGCFRFALALGLPRRAALAAAFLVAASPGIAGYAGFVMSDVAGVGAWLVTCTCALALARRQGDAPRALAIGGLAAGLLVALRVTHLVWIAGLALALPRTAWHGIAARPRALGAALACAALPLAALAWHQARSFGSPLHTGYDFWLDEDRFFAWRYVGAGARFYAAQLAGLRSDLLGRPLGWTSDLYALPAALLGAIGWALALRSPQLDAPARRVLAGVLVGALGALAIHLGFRWREARFLFPLVPFAAVGCAIACERIGPSFGRRGPVLMAAWTLAACVALTLAPIPQPGPLVAALHAELPPRLVVHDGVATTRLPLALASLFAPRAAVLVPSCDEPVAADVHSSLLRRHALQPLRVDPGYEPIWEALPRWREERCTRASPSSAKDTPPGSR